MFLFGKSVPLYPVITVTPISQFKSPRRYKKAQCQAMTRSIIYYISFDWWDTANRPPLIPTRAEKEFVAELLRGVHYWSCCIFVLFLVSPLLKLFTRISQSWTSKYRSHFLDSVLFMRQNNSIKHNPVFYRLNRVNIITLCCMLKITQCHI